jgi:hypothetical protein
MINQPPASRLSLHHRLALVIGAGTAGLLGACSAEPVQEKPVAVVRTRIYLDSPRRVAAAPDTTTPGQPYVRKVFLSKNALRQIAAAMNHPYAVQIKAFLDSQPRIPLESTLVGDTCYVELNPAQVPSAGSYTLVMRFAVDYMPGQRATDTTFVLTDKVIVRK